MNNSLLLKDISFHDEKILDLTINNNDLTIIVNNDLGKQYTFEIKNAKITSNSIIDIKQLIGKIIITLSYHKTENKEDYIHLEVANNN